MPILRTTTRAGPYITFHRHCSSSPFLQCFI
jgi:hypothetical protein